MLLTIILIETQRNVDRLHSRSAGMVKKGEAIFQIHGDFVSFTHAIYMFILTSSAGSKFNENWEKSILNRWYEPHPRAIRRRVQQQ